MRMPALYLVSALAGALVVASLAAGSSPVKRYTLPAAPPAKVAAPGTLTVSLPSEWSVKTAWPPAATDPRHPGVRWSIDALLQPAGTTLADLRLGGIWTGCRKGWGYEKLVADNYLTLPAGRVWHSTWRIYADKDCKTARFDRHRYLLDRKMAGRDSQDVVLEFDASCWIRDPAGRLLDECRTHRTQFAAIMRSIRFTG